jgi:hypothetical protein
MKVIVPLLDSDINRARVAIDMAMNSLGSSSSCEMTVFHVKDDIFRDSVDYVQLDAYLKQKVPAEMKYDIKIKRGVVPELELVRELKSQNYDRILIHHPTTFMERLVNRIFHSDVVDVIKEEIPNPEIVSVL